MHMNKHLKFFAIIISWTLLLGVFSSEAVLASSILDHTRGQILLQVEDLGQAWYVDPVSEMRVYLQNGSIAYKLMSSIGLGITTNDLEKIPASSLAFIKTQESICSSSSFAKELSGRILLQVENLGEAWYVYPENCRRIYLRDGETAYQIMRELGLGITNKNLELIEAVKQTIPPAKKSEPSAPVTTEELQRVIESNRQYYEELSVPMKMDSLFLLALIIEKEESFQDINLEKLIDESYRENPYFRMLDYQRPADETTYENSLNHLLTPFDQAIVKTLYCDLYGYTQDDLNELFTFRDNGYGDTHVLTSLLLLQKNNCLDQESIKNKIHAIATDVANAHDGTFNDLNSEIITFLYWAGYGNLIQEAWIRPIIDNQNTDHGFGSANLSNPHTNGLSTLALIYYKEKLQSQKFFPLLDNPVAKIFQ